MSNRRENNINIYLGKTDLNGIELNHEKCISILSEHEIGEFKKITNVSVKKRFLESRALLKICLAIHLKKKPGSFSIQKGIYGKPYISNIKETSAIEFNVTHTQSMIAIGISNNTKIGIDAEYLDEKKIDLILAEEFCSNIELKKIKAMSDKRRTIILYVHWISKEATLKCLGTGLSLEPKEFIFADINEYEYKPKLISAPSNIIKSRYKHEINFLTDNHILCVCTEDNVHPVKINYIEITKKLIDDFFISYF